MEDRSDLLIRIGTPRLSFTLYGPTDSRHGALLFESSDATGFLSFDLEPSNESAECVWRRHDGNLHSKQSKHDGPWLFEDTDYELVVESREGSRPRLVHRDPLLVQKIRSVGRRGDLLVGRINFGRNLGRTTFEIRIGNARVLRVTTEIFPTKLSYQEDYVGLLQDVVALSRALLLEYFRPTYREAGLGHGKAKEPLEWLVLLRDQLDALTAALTYIENHPHRQLVRQPRTVRTEWLKKPTAEILRVIRRGRGQGEWIQGSARRLMRAQLRATRVRETLDTAEHRWLGQEIRDLRRLVRNAIKEVAFKLDEARRRNWSIRRLEAEGAEFASIMARIESFENMEFIKSATGRIGSSFTSLTLTQMSGYREAFHSIRAIRRAFSLNGESLHITLKTLDYLYEIWCFLRLVQIIGDILGAQAELAGFFSVTSTAARVRLKRGHESCIKLKAENLGWLELCYNPSYPGRTGTQQPDIVIKLRHNEWPDMLLVFDAKYRLDNSSEYRKRFGGPGAPIEAVNALHRYRDAIVVSTPERERGRPVILGGALFPLAERNARDFDQHELWQSLTDIGIGAIPFLPGNTKWLTGWLKHILTQPPEILAEMGPPLLAWKHKLSSKHRGDERV